MNIKNLPLIYLASKSPRRKQILEDAGFSIRIIPIDVSENFPASMPYSQVAEYLANKKSQAIIDLPEDGYVLTADSIVVLEGEILEKPLDFLHAKEMLHKLSGKTHLVYTGVCLKNRKYNNSFTDVSKVSFYPLTDEEIEFYIEKYQPFDKAGSYGVQDWLGMCKVEKIEGSFYNIMGLPIHKVYETLQEMV